MDEYDTDTGCWDVEINPQGEYVNVFHPYSEIIQRHREWLIESGNNLRYAKAALELAKQRLEERRQKYEDNKKTGDVWFDALHDLEDEAAYYPTVVFEIKHGVAELERRLRTAYASYLWAIGANGSDVLFGRATKETK